MSPPANPTSTVSDSSNHDIANLNRQQTSLATESLHLNTSEISFAGLQEIVDKNQCSQSTVCDEFLIAEGENSGKILSSDVFGGPSPVRDTDHHDSVTTSDWGSEEAEMPSDKQMACSRRDGPYFCQDKKCRELNGFDRRCDLQWVFILELASSFV